MPDSDHRQLLGEAMEYLGAGNLPKAGALLRHVLDGDPDNHEALSALAILSQQLGRKDLALGFACSAVQVAPGVAAYQHRCAEAWLDAGEAQQAAVAYQRAIALDPARPEPHAGLGVALHQLGRWAESTDALRKAIELGLHDPAAYIELARSLVRTGGFDDAEACLRRAEEDDPSLAEIWQIRGEILGHRGRHAEAVAAFARALELAPRYARPHHGTGVVLALQGDFEAAAAAMRRALEFDPDYPEANCGLGAVLLRMGRAGDAIPCYERALAARPLYLEARADLALALEKAGRLSDAASQYEFLAEATSDHAFFRFLKASLGAEKTPPAAPPGLIAGMFDGYAAHFDEHLTKFLGYRAPQLVFQAVARCAPPRKLDILDLGCGTGLCGQWLKPLASSLVGIDLSPAMVQKAQERGIYDRLVVGDLLDASAVSGHFDLVAACDVFCYIGDLEPVFQHVAALLRPGGLFAFTVEAMDEGDYALQRTRRYSHSAAYIHQLAERQGYRPLCMDRVSLRTENKKDVAGLLVVLARP